MLPNHDDITYLCRPRGYTSPQGKKFQAIYQKFRSKCAHGMWTLLLLMYLRISYNAWLITDCLNIADNRLVSGIDIVIYTLYVSVYIYRDGTIMEMSNALMIMNTFFFSCLE